MIAASSGATQHRLDEGVTRAGLAEASAGSRLDDARRRLRHGVGPAISFGDQALASACNFLTTVLLARALGLEAFGIYSVAWLATYLAVSLQLGLVVSPMISIGPTKAASEADAYYGVVVIHEVLYVVVATVGIGLALSIVALAWPPFEGIPFPAAIAGATYLTQDFLRRYLFSRSRAGAVLLIDVINQALKIGVLFTLWSLGHLTIQTAMWAVATTAAISAACGLAFVRPLRWCGSTFVETTVRQWHSARWLVLTGSMQWLLGYSGVIVTAGLLDAKVVGALRTAQSVVSIIGMAREVVENVLPPLLGKAYVDHGVPGLRRTLLVAAVLGAGFGAAAVVGLALFGPQILVLLYGREVVGFEWVVIWYSAVFPIALLNVVQRCAFRTLEHTRPIFLSSLLAAVANVAIIYPATATFGVAGIIATTILCETIVLVVLGFVLRTCLVPQRGTFRCPTEGHA